ncbi:MAG: helix-turn-helix domain-containing protein [Methanopyri archaeon]|nr:helix-turn-helix domain-containing protein [Methanopyri archaeon]
MAETEAVVLDAMKKAGKPVRPGDVALATGLDKKDVSKALKELKDKGVVCSPKRCFYAPV